jgi:nitrogen-specific signal transduction histidine kinase
MPHRPPPPRATSPSPLDARIDERILELTREKQELERILSASGTIAVLVDGDLCIRRCTPEAFRLMGLGIDELGNALADSTLGRGDPPLAEDARRVLAGTPVDPRELDLGAGRRVLRRLLPRGDPGAGVIIVDTALGPPAIRDQPLHCHTDLPQVEDCRRSAFLSALGHELRNPLMPIANAVQLMGLSRNSPELLDWATGILARQSQRLLRLVEDLSDAARIGRGQLALERGRVVLQEVLKEALALLDPELTAHPRALQVVQPERPLVVEGDFSRLTQILVRLVDSAIGHTLEGDRLDLRLTARGDWAQLGVEHGGAADPATLAQIFEPAYLSDQPGQRSNGGAGLGLFVAHRLAQLHGGELTASASGRNQGSRFELRLPLGDKQIRGAADQGTDD